MPLFEALLKKISYTNEDILLLLGDLVEKGTMSLETLRYIIELSKKQQVFVLSGNCDTVWDFIKEDTYDQYLLPYLIGQSNSLLNEMCRASAIEVNESSSIQDIKTHLYNCFKEEIDWLEQLPHILDSQHFVFAHAGLQSDVLEEQDAHKVMKNDAFAEKKLVFSKYLVVGHWPTINYTRTIGCCNPILHKEQRIISIDGGNVIKRDGQLNALIIENNDVHQIRFESADMLPTEVVIEAQTSNSDTIFISWSDNKVELLEEGHEFSYCRHLSSGHCLWVSNSRLYMDKNQLCCYDCTDYFLPLKKGDVVSIIERTSHRTLAKKDGVIGWVWNEKLCRG